jgi:hypothetical protein
VCVSRFRFALHLDMMMWVDGVEAIDMTMLISKFGISNTKDVFNIYRFQYTHSLSFSIVALNCSFKISPSSFENPSRSVKHEIDSLAT